MLERRHSEAEKAPPFAFGSNRWGKLRLDDPSDKTLDTPYVPRSMIFVDPGIEGLEWFVGSDLSQWELHPSTKEFQEHGQEWGRMNGQGELRHNFYRPQREFGAQMCLRSGWLDFLKLSIDRVLKNHPLDGVYYDWNVALLCSNPLHESATDPTAPAKGHWDVDELLDLMEWTRARVGKDGLVIVHNTTVPMFAVENFADYVVATEWGYKKWTDRAPDLQGLPLETSLAGAIPRGVISYGVLSSDAPRRLHRLFAIEAFLNGETPWPASEETFALLHRIQFRIRLASGSGRACHW